MNKDERIAQIESKMKQCCAEFQTQINELKKPEWQNPMEYRENQFYYQLGISGGILTYDSASICSEEITYGNIYQSEKLAEQVRDRQKLWNLMLKDSLDSWQGEEVDWHNNYQKKVGIGGINHSSGIIRTNIHSFFENFIIPSFKTKKSLLVSIKRHRELFDKVHGSKGYEIS